MVGNELMRRQTVSSVQSAMRGPAMFDVVCPNLTQRRPIDFGTVSSTACRTR
jgi:hypothetical protein